MDESDGKKSKNSSLIRVGVVDNSPLVQAALKHLFSEDGRFDLVVVCSDGEKFVNAVDRVNFDVGITGWVFAPGDGRFILDHLQAYDNSPLMSPIFATGIAIYGLIPMIVWVVRRGGVHRAPFTTCVGSLHWSQSAIVSCRVTAAHFEVNPGSAIRFAHQYETEGSVALKVRVPHKRRLDPYGEGLLNWIEETPDMTLQELSGRIPSVDIFKQRMDFSVTEEPGSRLMVVRQIYPDIDRVGVHLQKSFSSLCIPCVPKTK